MRHALKALPVAALIVALWVEAVPESVIYLATGLLVAHWISEALAGVRDALQSLAGAAVKPPAPFSPDWDTCPSRPIFGEPGFEDETAEHFELRSAHYDMRRDAWLLQEARRMVTSR